MIIREYEYEEKRPFNCQERFIEIDGDNAWEKYIDLVLKKNILHHGFFEEFTIFSEDENALACYHYYKICNKIGRYIHVSQDWTNHFKEEPIVIKVKENGEYEYLSSKE